MRTGMKSPRGKRGANFSFADSDGLQAGDSVGNRQKFSESRINADDIGNRLPNTENQVAIRDDIGNSVGMGPTHLESGILVAMDARGRRRRDHKSSDSRHSNQIGGVNPLVSGNQALLSMYLMEKGDEPVDSGAVTKKVVIRKEASPKTPSEGDSRRANRAGDRSLDSSDRWLKRLLELEDEDRLEAAKNADPKAKAIEARACLSEIMTKGEVMAAIGTQVSTDPQSGRPNVLVSFEDIDIEDTKSQLANLFAHGSLPLLALNFLVNKIVNKNPEERVRIQVAIRKSQKN